MHWEALELLRGLPIWPVRCYNYEYFQATFATCKVTCPEVYPGHALHACRGRYDIGPGISCKTCP